MYYMILISSILYRNEERIASAEINIPSRIGVRAAVAPATRKGVQVM